MHKKTVLDGRIENFSITHLVVTYMMSFESKMDDSYDGKGYPGYRIHFLAVECHKNVGFTPWIHEETSGFSSLWFQTSQTTWSSHI